MNLAKALRIIGIQLRNNWVREVIYRPNFLTAGIVDFVWFITEISLFTVIYAHTSSLAGWTQMQVYFFLGVFFVSDAFFTVFMSRNFWMFSDLVSKGELDTFLLKPAPALLLILTRSMNLTAVFNILLGVAVMIRFAKPAGFAGGWLWLDAFFWVLIGFFSQTVLRFLFSVWVFWTDRGFTLSALYYNLFTLATKPDRMYPQILRYIIMTALPFALIASIPARALLEGLSQETKLAVGGSLLGLTLLSGLLWKRGLLRYQSASS